MTEAVNNQAPDLSGIPPEAILADLKEQATRLGVNFHSNIGEAALREKLKEHKEIIARQAQELLDEQAAQAAAANPAPPPVDQSTPLTEKQKADKRRLFQKREAEKLVRVNITCMNQAKKEYPGEIFTFGNRVVGEVKKYVPFGKDTHVPNCILQIIENRQCMSFETKDAAGNRRPKQIKEFGVRYLPQLTREEIKELAIQQAAAAGKV